MSIIIDNKYIVKEETYLKAAILTSGVEFSKKALNLAILENAKVQNLVYNMPINALNTRPQELIITNIKDNYSVVVSCVASNLLRKPVYIDVDYKNRLIAFINEKKLDGVEIHFVKEPDYYKKILTNGEIVKKYISACGLDELNIIPWKGCAISKKCKFCGINNFINDDLSAYKVSVKKDEWNNKFDIYLNNLEEAISIAIKSSCYLEHAHVILISGNLDNNSLDFQTEIFGQIVKKIYPLVKFVSNEGIVVVMTPPHNMNLISELKKSGVSKVVFNLEAITEDGFKKYCPGKADLGYDFFINRLEYAVNEFGKGNVWTNLVFGLENKDDVLEKCLFIIKKGIVVSANVLHLDKGHTLDCSIPNLENVIDFFYRLEILNKSENFKPFYCSKALRTSLTNEAHNCRIKEIKDCL